MGAAGEASASRRTRGWFRSELQMRSHSHWSADALPPESSATGAVRTVRKLYRLSEKSRQPARASNMKSSLRIVITENPV